MQCEVIASEHELLEAVQWPAIDLAKTCNQIVFYSHMQCVRYASV